MVSQNLEKPGGWQFWQKNFNFKQILHVKWWNLDYIQKNYHIHIFLSHIFKLALQYLFNNYILFKTSFSSIFFLQKMDKKAFTFKNLMKLRIPKKLLFFESCGNLDKSLSMFNSWDIVFF